MEFKLYRCAHCGNVIFKVVDKGVPVMCCGQKMEEFVPNTTDGAMEKHVPAVEKIAHGSGYSVSVKVGSVEHPMLPEHYISMIAAVDGDTVTMKFPKPGEKPELKTSAAVRRWRRTRSATSTASGRARAERARISLKI